MQKIKIGGLEYEAKISGNTRDQHWSGRESKTIMLKISYNTAISTFVDDIKWSILYQPPEYIDPETQEPVKPPVEEYDNSEYCVPGSITDNRDGTVTVKMGKPTFEELYNILKEAAESEPTAEV